MRDRLARRLPPGLKRRLRPWYNRWRYRHAARRNQEKARMLSSQTIRWGILSTGSIAAEFAQGLSVLPDAHLAAVGSRSQDSADAFGARFGIPQRYDSYEALATDPDVDVIYIGTPHPFHYENTMLCLEAGKHVLCEKPFALNAKQAEAMRAKAQERGLFLMEAMWMRFIPATARALELVIAGEIGNVQMVRASFGFNPPYDPQSRLFDPALGGGALLDIGVYPLTFANIFMGPFQTLTGVATLGSTGVDESLSLSARDHAGAVASLSASLRTYMANDAYIEGDAGRLRIHANFWHSQHLTLTPQGGKPREIPVPMDGNGYNYEAAEVMRCLRAGETESATWPLDTTVNIMRQMDDLRAAWGVRYPGEDDA
ncbi:MAG: Gfo/Idh/MocA family protein [Anaerolineales bacterium]